MKALKKWTAAALALLLLCGSATLPVVAETTPSEKEEVIYTMTDSSGRVTDMEAVNIFSGGDILDYGDYSAVKSLNTTDRIKQNGDEISFSSTAEKVYYQGSMKTKELPWKISIRYFLGGKELSATDLAGKSGALEIRFTVSKNEGCKGDFYENYALQATFTLDTDRCKNISADGATLANVGSKKQLNYTLLPGKGLAAVIRADVKDFQMDAVTINGVRLNLDVGVDDADLMARVDELISATGSIDSGASGVSSGTKTLADATALLDGQVGEFYNGVDHLTSGAGELSSGLSAIAAQNDQLTGSAATAYEGLCEASAAALNIQLKEKGMEPVTLTPSTYSAVLLDLLAKLDAEAVYRQAYQTALQRVTQQVEAQADKLYTAYIQAKAAAIYEAYITEQADALYAEVASQAVKAQLLQSGYSDEQASIFLQSAEGRAAVDKALANMTEEQKAQIRSGAIAKLTAEQKEEILQGAVGALTAEEKRQIREGYIQQMMGSADVTAQINAAVAEVSAAAEQVSRLKGQLDSYGAFCQGLQDYTAAVGAATAGAQTLKLNMDSLYANTGKLHASVGELNSGAQKLYSGTQKLADGTAEFAGKTSTMDTEINDKINSMTSAISGDDRKTVSFVSPRNTRVNAVQFVIKTTAIEKAEAAVSEAPDTAPLTFGQKLLRLFGLY